MSSRLCKDSAMTRLGIEGACFRGRKSATEPTCSRFAIRRSPYETIRRSRFAGFVDRTRLRRDGRGSSLTSSLQLVPASQPVCHRRMPARLRSGLSRSEYGHAAGCHAARATAIRAAGTAATGPACTGSAEYRLLPRRCRSGDARGADLHTARKSSPRPDAVRRTNPDLVEPTAKRQSEIAAE